MRFKIFWALCIITAIVLFIMSLQSCTTPRQIAQRKLRKALRIDPTVITTLDKDTAVYRMLHIPFKVTVPGIERESRDFDCDSILRAFAKLPATQQPNQPGANEIYLYKDTGAVISVLKKPNGKMSVAFKIAPYHVYDTLNFRDTLKITMPARILRVEVKAPFYTYFWFWGMSIALVLETVLFFMTERRRRVV